jgi:hypothetical protein
MALLVLTQVTYKPDFWVHVGDPSNNISVKVTEDLDKMKEHDFLVYMPSVSGGGDDESDDDGDDDDDDDGDGELMP